MTHHNDRDSRFEISVVTLGTAGGPRWWQGDSQMERNGIATAIVVPGGFYLDD